MAKKESTGTTTYSVNMPHQAAWIVYINGIEVPVNSVNVEFGVWSIPTAQIRLVPHVILQRIGHEDRLQVEIYYLDLFFDPALPKMCFMGEFEVVGWSYQTTAAGRFLQLDCRSHLKILEQLRFYYMSSLSDMAMGLSAPTATSGDTFTAPSVVYPLSLFNQGLVPDANNPEAFISSPFEFIKNLLVALTAPVDLESTSDTTSTEGALPRTATGVAGRNFFGRWIEMTNFRRRWSALPYFDDTGAKSIEGCFPIMKAISSTEVLNAIKQQIGENVGNSGTAWELLQRVYGTMFMEILAVPSPPAVQMTAKTNLIEGSFTRRGGSKDDANYGGLASYIVKPQCIFGIPPACNIIFPSMIRTYATSENYERQPTRIYLGEAYVSGLLSSGASGDMQTVAGELLVTGYPGIVRERMTEYRNNTNLNTRNFLIYPEELYKGPVSKHINAPAWLYMLEKLGQKSVSETAVKVGGRTYAAGKGKIRRIAEAVPVYGMHVKAASKAYGIPEDVIWGVIGHESAYNPLSRNKKDGGGGLMQLMHETFIGAYTKARAKDPGLKPLGNYGTPTKVLLKPATAKKAAKYRTVYGEAIYADLFNPQKNIYAGINYLARLVKQAGVTNFAASETNPNNPIPSLLQCALLGYNAGEGNLTKLLSQRAAFLAKPEGQRDTAAFEETWKFISPMTGKRDEIAHWRVYSRGVNKSQLAYIAYSKMQPTGATADAPSSPSAPLPGDEDYIPAQDQTVPGRDVPWNAADKDTAIAATPEGTSDAGSAATGPELFDPSATTQALGELFKVYAKYEYYRSRFETRSATVSLAFNPYIIPGFSAVILDNSISGFHTIGYVNSVSHSFSAQGDMQTSVVLSYTRTLPEYLKLMITGSNDQDLNDDGLSSDYAVGPTEVIAEVADVFQVPSVVEDFYQRVLYPDISKGTPLFFDIDRFLILRDFDGTQVSSEQDLPDSPNSWNPEKGLIAIPTPEFESYFSSYDSAMSFVARPVATLQQMIELRNGAPLDELLKNKKSGVEGPIDTFTDENKSARFYARIYQLAQPREGGIDDVAIQAITNVGGENTSSPEGNWQIITASHNIPESRRNWDQTLINYRNLTRGNAGAALT